MKLEDEDLVASAVRHEAVVNLALHSNLDSMSPSTPQRSHSRKFSIASTPGTPDTGYVLAQESLEDSPTPAGSHASRPDLDETSSLPEIDNDATSFQLQHNLLQSNPSPRRQDTSASNSSSASGSGSYSTDPELLEMLENDDTETDFDITEEELEDGLLSDVGDPLVSRGRRRRRKRWIEDEEVKEKSLFEVRCLPWRTCSLAARATSDTGPSSTSTSHARLTTIQFLASWCRLLHPDSMCSHNPLLLRPHCHRLSCLVG